MKVNKLILLKIFFITSHISLSQVSGNINYQKQIDFSKKNNIINPATTMNVTISSKGIANVKADSYVAIFSLTQVGKTTEEVNQIIDQRISQALANLKQKNSIETFVDMISFVPIYEFEVEKKIFSKRSYNEIPKGFELKKNIHIKFSDANQLNEIISVLSMQEIYDLARVDYFSNDLESVKNELMTKSNVIIQQKMKNYENLLGTPFTNNDKRISDGFKIMLPVEMYQTYEAFSSSSLNLKKTQNVNFSEKITSLYYQPVVYKDFDFVINPVILEPVIQVMYEVEMVIVREKTEIKSQKEYMLITPNGDLKSLNIK